MIEINLIPDVKLELIRAVRQRTTIISIAITVGVIAIAVVVILAIYVYGAQAFRNVLADDAIKNGSAELAKVEDLSKLVTIQNQLTKIDGLNSEKQITSRVFDMLSSIIPPSPDDVQISQINVDTETGNILIEGQSAGSYKALETFKKTVGFAQVQSIDSDNKSIEVPLASNISTSEVSYGEDTSGGKVLRFNLSFDYAPELLSSQSKNVKIVLNIQGNVTDSYLGVPKSIFVDRARDVEETQ